MPYVDKKGNRLPTPRTRTGFVAQKIPLLDTQGLRVIIAPIKGITPAGLFQHGAFVFQCPPLDSFQEQFAYNHGDFPTAFAGERSRPGGRQLETIQFDTLWLDDGSARHGPAWTIVPKAIDPIAAKNRLKAILYSGKPFWMMAHQMPVWHKYDLRMMATMRSLTSQEKHGEEDARYFSIQVREWRDASIQDRVMGEGAPHGGGKRGATGAVSVRALPDTQDSLHKLSKWFYGTTTMATAIAKANGIKGLGSSESLKVHFAKHPNTKLKLPSLRPVATNTKRIQ